MPRRKPDAELSPAYAKRRAREEARGFRSAREATKTRREARELGVANPSKLSAAELRNLTRYASEGRRVSGKLSGSSPAKFRQDKAGNLDYVTAYHNWVQMKQNGGVSVAERKEILRQFFEEQYDVDIESYEDFMDDGGSVPE